MHGGRELIFVPPSSEEVREGGNHTKGSVTEFRRSTPAVQREERKSTVIPFRLPRKEERAVEENTGTPRRSRSRKKKFETPAAIDRPHR